jgi:GMP synthase (glutamine-hydrolysing)
VSTPASSSCGQLAGVADPEAKRKIIGREFVDGVPGARPAKRSGDAALARRRARIYPDVIESGGAHEQEGRAPSRATTTSAACPRHWA